MLGLGAACAQRLVGGVDEEVRPPPPERQRPGDEKELGQALVEAFPGLLHRHRRGLLEQPHAQLEIDRAAVVGIDEAQIPELAALVEVGDAGSGQRQQLHRERVHPARHPERRHESVEVASELGVAEAIGHEPAQGFVVVGIGIDPGGVRLGLFAGLLHVGEGAVERQRVGAHQRLIEEVLGVAVGPLAGPVAGVYLGPTADRPRPLARHLREQREPRAHVLAPLGVVR